MRSFKWSVLLVMVMAFGGAAVASAQDSVVTVANGSAWTIYHFFLSPVDQNTWGPDQLGDEVVATGASFTITDVPCDAYDVKLVDEDGDECVVGGVPLCDDDMTVDITDENLLGCQAATEQPGEEEQPAEEEEGGTTE